MEDQPIPIAAGEIEDRLHSLTLQQGTNRKRSESHDRVLKLGHVDHIDPSPEEFSVCKKLGKIVALGRLEFSDNDEFARF